VKDAPPPAVAAPAAPAPAPPDAADDRPTVEANRTLLYLPASSKGHRIFVDGHVVGSGPDPVKARCGTHLVKVGSSGRPRLLSLPCGGELSLK
jgi:hypothetical protein